MCHTPAWSQRRTPWPYEGQIHILPRTEQCGRYRLQPDNRGTRDKKGVNKNTASYLNINHIVVFVAETSHQALGAVDYVDIQGFGRDFVQGNDGVSALQLSLLQQLFTSHLTETNQNTVG